MQYQLEFISISTQDSYSYNAPTGLQIEHLNQYFSSLGPHLRFIHNSNK